MRLLARIGWVHRGLALILVAGLVWAAMSMVADEPEIALTPGEPWEQMRHRSSAKIGPAIAGHHWFRTPQSDARLRLADAQYGFVTPLARFFTVGFDGERVDGIRMSPQIEPLRLDDTIKVVLDLQDQWRKNGWVPIRVKHDPPIENTPEWRAQLRDTFPGSVSYWQAGEKYQVMMIVRRVKDHRNPGEERYLITLSLATPWVRS